MIFVHIYSVCLSILEILHVNRENYVLIYGESGRLRLSVINVINRNFHNSPPVNIKSPGTNARAHTHFGTNFFANVTFTNIIL